MDQFSDKFTKYATIRATLAQIYKPNPPRDNIYQAFSNRVHIQLWSSNIGAVSHYLMILAKFSETLLNRLKIIIYIETLNLLPCLLLYQGILAFKTPNTPFLFFKKLNPYFYGEVINECEGLS